MSKIFQLWARDDEGKAIVIDPKEIEKKINLCGSDMVKFPTVKTNVEYIIKKLNQALKEKEEHPGVDDIEEFLKEVTDIEAGFSHCDGIEDKQKEPMLAYDFYNNEFFDFSDLDEEEIYQYWDGSNWKYIWVENCSVTEIEISEEKYCLDEWDGRNMVTGGTGLHEYVYKLIKEDGEPSTDEYFILYSSQWQGSLDEGETMSENQLISHLEELERNVEEYMEEIKKLK